MVENRDQLKAEQGADQLLSVFFSKEELDKFGEELEKYRGELFIGLLCGGSSQEQLCEAGCLAIYRDPADLLLHYAESPLAQ